MSIRFWIIRRTGIIRKALAALVFVSAPAAAQAVEGFYIGYGVARVEIGGDMDGRSYVAGGGSMEVLPEQETAMGREMMLGYRGAGLGFEMGLTRSEHDSQWLGALTTTEFRSLNLDFKYHFRRASRIQPMFILGIGFTNVTVKDGSTDGSRVQDAEFHGVDARLGGGIALVLHEHFALDIQAVYRYGSYNTVDGISSGSIEDDINGDGLTTSAIAKVIF